jgi:hypothetical protein
MDCKGHPPPSPAERLVDGQQIVHPPAENILYGQLPDFSGSLGIAL